DVPGGDVRPEDPARRVRGRRSRRRGPATARARRRVHDGADGDGPGEARDVRGQVREPRPALSTAEAVEVTLAMKTLALLAVLPLLAFAGAALREPEPKVRTLLMFEGDAEEAMTWYVSLIPGSKVLDVERYGAGDALGKEGSVKIARFALGGTEYVCIDSA